MTKIITKNITHNISHPKSFSCALKPHAKFQNPRTTHSVRKVASVGARTGCDFPCGGTGIARRKSFNLIENYDKNYLYQFLMEEKELYSNAVKKLCYLIVKCMHLVLHFHVFYSKVSHFCHRQFFCKNARLQEVARKLMPCANTSLGSKIYSQQQLMGPCFLFARLLIIGVQGTKILQLFHFQGPKLSWSDLMILEHYNFSFWQVLGSLILTFWLEISAQADVGPCSRVWSRLTLRPP